MTPLADLLLPWFDAHHRPLPWRADRDPYRIWVSEVMLQQTTVAAVGPYFERFVAALPDLKSLAAADEQQVLKLWEGLGYYRRARHLHAAARQLVTDHGGMLPNDPSVWAGLPGVGRYILGAVLSQAFDRRLPIVEANSLRVFSRWFAYPGDPREREGKKWVWAAADAVLPARRVGDFNQAVMELGATVCKPAAPRCGECPAARWCEANRLGLQGCIPPPAKAKVVAQVREIGVAVWDGRGRVLVCRRPSDAKRWQNMWELPHGEVQTGESDAEAAARVTEDLTGLEIAPGQELMTVKHGITRWRVTLTILEATRTGGRFRPGVYAEARWASPAELGPLPASSPQRTVLTELGRAGRQRRLF